MLVSTFAVIDSAGGGPYEGSSLSVVMLEASEQD